MCVTLLEFSMDVHQSFIELFVCSYKLLHTDTSVIYRQRVTVMFAYICLYIIYVHI